jgi:hypothetical protein
MSIFFQCRGQSSQISIIAEGKVKIWAATVMSVFFLNADSTAVITSGIEEGLLLG